MITFIFTKTAEKQFKKFEKEVKERMIEKLHELKKHNNIFSVITPLYNFQPATHRLRIGNYRLLLHIQTKKGQNYIFWVLKVGHRKNIYR